jgi:hypothetical protein
LRAGSYTLKLIYYGINSAAIATIYIDGVSQGTVDMYDAGSTPIKISTLAITVVGDGYHKINLKVASKNASSSNYNMFMQCYNIYPASD